MYLLGVKRYNYVLMLQGQAVVPKRYNFKPLFICVYLRLQSDTYKTVHYMFDRFLHQRVKDQQHMI